MNFDSTCGFPGEGPTKNHFILPQNRWSLSTANIGSLKTSSFWQSDEDNIYCLQETRIGKNNYRTSCQQVQATRHSLFCSELLSGIIRSDGRHITMHGGTAIIAPDSIARPFEPKDDATNLYKEIFKTKRINACWVQISSRVRALVFLVYAKTGASASREIFEQNNDLFDKILLIASQFGDIPVLLAGDFQFTPLSYPSIAHAVHFEGWSDPLVSSDAEGRLHRPITFSLDGTFAGEGEGCSSIDGILLNRVAFCALHSIEVVELQRHQHRPVRAVFSWEPIYQVGEIHSKFAALDHTGLQEIATQSPHSIEETAQKMWKQEYHENFDAAPNFSSKWDVINNFCLQTLLNCGSRWGFGAQKRGCLPQFTKKTICPGQLPNGAAANHKGSQLYKTLRQLWELETRLKRPSHTLRDAIIFQRTAKKVWKALGDLHSPWRWQSPFQLSLVEVFNNCVWVQVEIHFWENSRKNMRINAWRTRMRDSAKSTKKTPFSPPEK